MRVNYIKRALNTVGTILPRPPSPRGYRISIVIPTLNRSDKLDLCLRSITEQIESTKEKIQIVVSDNFSSDETNEIIKLYSDKYTYITHVRQPHLLSVEESALAAMSHATGEYMWMFGDDDYLEPGGLKHVLKIMTSQPRNLYILNRSRSNDDLSHRISDNWMELPENMVKTYPSLKDFVYEWGLLSIIGFYNASIFKRADFQAVDFKKYCRKNLYAHVGALMEAFHQDPATLIGKPIFCHRTTLDRKNQSYSNDGVSRSHLKVAFGLDGIGTALFLEELRKSGAMTYSEMARTNEYLDKTTLLGKLVRQISACEDRNILSGAQRRYYQNMFRQLDWSAQEASTQTAVGELLTLGPVESSP